VTALRLLARLGFLAILCLLASLTAFSQSAKQFQGEWEWAIYAKSRDELPPAYREARLKEVPNAALYLKLKQRGNKLTGDYSASRRFLARLEEGELDSVVRGRSVRLELQSGFGGTITVLLTREGNRLHWKVTKAEGEYYFPDDVYLRRIVRKKRR
jgi:hypothetical protein